MMPQKVKEAPGRGGLLLSLMTGTQFLGPTGWKERPCSQKLFSHLHTHTYRCVDISPSQKHTNKLIENSMIFNNDAYTKYLRRLQLSLGSTY